MCDATVVLLAIYLLTALCVSHGYPGTRTHYCNILLVLHAIIIDAIAAAAGATGSCSSGGARKQGSGRNIVAILYDLADAFWVNIRRFEPEEPSCRFQVETRRSTGRHAASAVDCLVDKVTGQLCLHEARTASPGIRRR